MVSRAQKRFANSGITYEIGIDELIAALAAGHAISHSLEDRSYIDAVVDEAFKVADAEFNTEAVAMGQAGTIKHMFEWGTVGVNRGRTNVRPNPNSPAARLWTNFTEGQGLDRTIWFAYRPSVAFVPKPTTAETGMSSEVINKMRDHVFRWKAEVMEEGHDVMISPRKAKFLLIPAYEENRPYMRPNDIKRGYMLTKGPIVANPGAAKQAGNFTAFWMDFWNGRGADILEESVNQQIMTDFEPEFVKPRTSKSLRAVGTFDVKTLVEKKSKQVQSKVKRKAKTR